MNEIMKMAVIIIYCSKMTMISVLWDKWLCVCKDKEHVLNETIQFSNYLCQDSDNGLSAPCVICVSCTGQDNYNSLGWPRPSGRKKSNYQPNLPSPAGSFSPDGLGWWFVWLGGFFLDRINISMSYFLR